MCLLCCNNYVGMGELGKRNMILEGEIPHSLASGTRNYAERQGSSYTAQWRTLGGECGHTYQMQLHGVAGTMGLSQPFHNPLNTYVSTPKGVGTSQEPKDLAHPSFVTLDKSLTTLGLRESPL